MDKNSNGQHSSEGLFSSKIRVSIKDLRAIAYQLFVANGLPQDQAEITADCLVEADSCGVSTHGISILPAHLNKLQSGSYNLKPSFNVIRNGGAFAVINGDNAMGAVSAVHCMKYAMEKCSQTGIFTVFCNNCNTYGAAFYYPLLAAKEGLIGMTFSNSPAAMAPWGGMEKLFGTNPFSIVVPCKDNKPIIFDMATSKVAKSKINEARIQNKEIPLGWALDSEGNPTTDPLEAIKGFVLPMADYKGYGLALTIDILSGVLSGAAFLNNVGKFYSEDGKCMNVGQTFIAMNPRLVYGEGFYEAMDRYVEIIRSSKKNENNKVSLPGDQKMKIKEESIRNGVLLDKATVFNLNKCLNKSGISDLIIEL